MSSAEAETKTQEPVGQSCEAVDEVVFDTEAQLLYDVMLESYWRHVTCREAHENSARGVNDPPLTPSERVAYDRALNAYDESTLEFLHHACAFMHEIEGE